MRIEPSNNIHERGRITKPAGTQFKDEAPEGSYADTVKDIFYSPGDSSARLSEYNSKANKQYSELIDKAVSDGHLTPEDAAVREKNFLDGKLGPYNPQPRSHDVKILDSLHELEDTRFCLNRHGQQVGDGLIRPMDFYVGPGHMKLAAAAQGWEMSPDENGQDIPVADLVVIGAGPGGLTTAYQTARRGGRVVCFEAELAGSAFSDTGAKAIHHMRTSVELTSLIRDGHGGENRKHPLSLHGQMSSYRPHAKAGRDSMKELTGQEVPGIYKHALRPDDENSPATRGELYEHLSSLSYSLANDFDNAMLAERSPVNSVTYKDGLFTITTSRGHKIKAKDIGVSMGLMGPEGEKGRMLNIFQDLKESDPENYVIVGRDGDSVRKTDELEKIAKHERDGGIIINDRQLGDQAVRQTFASLPAGSTVGVVGSGESALKAALETLHLNPGVSVDLFVKKTLQAAQIQLPIETFHPAVLETTQEDPEAIVKAKAAYKVFGTPVTPRSFQEFMEFQASGRARLVELGDYFDESTVELTATGDGTTRLNITDPEIAQNVKDGAKDFQKKDLLPTDSAPIEGKTYEAFIQSVGWKTTKMKDHPMLKLESEAWKHIHVNTAGDSQHPAQSSMPGLSTRGRHIAEKIASGLPEDRRIDLMQPRFWQDTPAEEVEGIIENRGLHPNFVKNVKKAIDRDGSHPQELKLIFTADDEKLREIARKPEDKRTPAEQETLERGYLLANKMKDYSESLKDPA